MGFLRGPFGFRSESVRSPFGVRWESVRGPLGVRAGSVRGPFEICSRGVRGPCRVRAGSVRDSFGVCSGSVRGPFGIRSCQFRTKIFGTKNSKFQKFSICAAVIAAAGALYRESVNLPLGPTYPWLVMPGWDASW